MRQRRIHPEKVLGTENPADLMTKYQDAKTIEKMMSKMGMEFPEGRAESAPKIDKAENGKVDSVQNEYKTNDENWTKKYEQADGGRKVVHPNYDYKKGEKLVASWADEVDDHDVPIDSLEEIEIGYSVDKSVDEAVHYKLREEKPLRNTPHELHYYYDEVVELNCDEEQSAEQAEVACESFEMNKPRPAYESPGTESTGRGEVQRYTGSSRGLGVSNSSGSHVPYVCIHMSCMMTMHVRVILCVYRSAYRRMQTSLCGSSDLSLKRLTATLTG